MDRISNEDETKQSVLLSRKAILLSRQRIPFICCYCCGCYNKRTFVFDLIWSDIWNWYNVSRVGVLTAYFHDIQRQCILLVQLSQWILLLSACWSAWLLSANIVAFANVWIWFDSGNWRKRYHHVTWFEHIS